MSGNGREDLGDVWEWSGGPFGCPEVVGRPSGMSGSNREVSGMSGRGREVLSAVWEWSGVPLGYPGVAVMIFWMSGSVREALPDVQEWSEDPQSYL